MIIDRLITLAGHFKKLCKLPASGLSHHRTYHESDLVKGLVSGDKEIYKHVYKLYYPQLFQYAIRLLKTKEPSEDVCNEVFLKLWENRTGLQDLGSLKAYLLVSVRNASLNTLKRRCRQQEARKEIEKQFPGTTLSSESRFLEKEYITFIQTCIRQLPPRSQQVFKLCREEGYSYEEVSSELGISRNAVKSHMVYSLKKLKAILRKDLDISWTILFFLPFF